MPRAVILRRRADFDRVREEGARAVRSTVVCNYLLLPGQPSRAAFVVGRACGGAVVRNKIKRRMREIYRQYLAPTLMPGLQTVWIARQNAACAVFAELKQDMLGLAAKAWGHPLAPPPPR